MTATLVHSADSQASSTLESLREQIPDFAKDIRLNLGTVMTAEGAPDLSQDQMYGIALATAYATKHPQLVAAVEGSAAALVDASIVQAAKAAASIMAMNNVYYRFLHLVHDAELSKLPAKLRMNVIANPGIAKVDFELMSLAVSAVNGCGMCMEAHVHEVSKAGVSKVGIQSAVRIAATINAVAQALTIG
jgi:alkyl hydroperoxide reductase subunit D